LSKPLEFVAFILVSEYFFNFCFLTKKIRTKSLVFKADSWKD